MHVTIKRLHSAKGSGRKQSLATAAKWLHRKWCNAQFRTFRPQVHCPPCFGTQNHTYTYMFTHLFTYAHTVAYTNPNTHGQSALRHNMCSERRAVTQTPGLTFGFCGSLCREMDLGKKSKPDGGALHPHMSESQRKLLVSSTVLYQSCQLHQQWACGSLLSSVLKQI